MFSQFCLDTIWKFYTATWTGGLNEQNTGVVDIELLKKLAKSIPELGQVDLEKLKPGCIKETLGRWLPIANSILKHCIDDLPSPVV